MNIIFFQNCISPHQIPYISECINDPKVQGVYLIAPRVDYSIRKDMGWDSINLLKGTNIKYFLTPNDEQVCQLLENESNIFCIFSGIRADKDVFHWFKLSLKYQVHRYIITEPPYTYNKPLWMHYIRFYLQDYRFIKRINGIFGIGEMAVNYYRNISKKWNVFPFQYVTQNIQRSSPIPSGRIKLLFVGSLIPRKNVKIVIEALKNNSNIDFTIIGDGKEKRKLELLANRNHVNINFLGTQSMQKIPVFMQQHDILILPSLHDGWGAVVNEAITLGLYVIVSDRCGAKALIKSIKDGYIYKCHKISDLKQALQYITDNITNIRANTEKRIEQAQQIQGKNVAKYFVNCLLQS